MKKFLTVVLTIVFTLSLASMALAANTNSAIEADENTTYEADYPTGYGVTGGDLKSTFTNSDLDKDNGLINANQSGVGVGDQSNIGEDAVKNVDKQRTHGEYQNNTNSCASCHQVHTAAAENLLFKNGVYATCTACHDGTLGVLNVFASSTAGTFGGTVDGNASMHLPNAVVLTKAAPGGNHDSDVAGNWEGEFTCASCHSPHGSYSDRLLNYNPNHIGESDMYFRTTTGAYADASGNILPDQNDTNKRVKTGGLAIKNATVQVGVPSATATSDEFIVVRTTAGDAALDKKVTQEAAATPVIVVMKKVGDTKDAAGNFITWKYVRDLTPWIGNVYNTRNGEGLQEITNFYPVDYTPATYKTKFVKFSANPSIAKNADDKIIVRFGQAYVKNGPAAGLNDVALADISRANIVKFGFLSTPKATFNGLDVLEVNVNSYDGVDKDGNSIAAYKNFGVQISTFCASCHTDYFVSAGTDASGQGRGVWSKAFRHNTTSDSYTCLKCHFAHGTDVSVMLDARDRDINDLVGTQGIVSAAGVPATLADAKAYMIDNNSSSALKRYTNMSVCWKCHTSSHSEDLTNNVWVQGATNAGILSSTEFNKVGSNLPQGWVGADPSATPYEGNNNTATE